METKMLISLKDKDGIVVLVNPKHVTTIFKSKTEDFTRIYLAHGQVSCMYIKETPEEIYVKLNNV